MENRQDGKKADESVHPGIEEIRTIRKEISEQFGNDVRRLCEHLRELQEKYADRIVRAPEPSKENAERRIA